MLAKTNSTILAIDDDKDVLASLNLFLKHHFEKIIISNSPSEINRLISQHDIDLVLLDMNFRKSPNDGKEGLYWLKHLKELRADIPVVLLTAYGSIDLAVDSLKKGASDFIVKPWNNQKLLNTLLRSLEKKKKGTEVKHSSVTDVQSINRKNEFQLSPKSALMKKALTLATKVAATDANILITGENGTGKEVMAKYIHENSNRSKGAFIALDLGAVNENLFEAELFGYKKGAFTDAKEDKPGRFELAEGGTLFLDEIGNIPLFLQSKLLTAIQTKTVQAVGSNVVKKVECRIICATNLDLSVAVKNAEFRQDLLFRINTIEIKLPALRERKEDILGLVQHFLTHFNDKYQKQTMLSTDALNELVRYPWPGNIRELQHAIERCVILADGHQISSNDLMLSEVESLDISNIDDLDLEQLEEKHVKRILIKFDGNVSQAAKALNINRNTLYRKMKKYGI